MILTAKQEEGLKLAVRRYHDREPWTCIAGYAGTGKSTLVKFIVSALDINPVDVCYELHARNLHRLRAFFLNISKLSGQ